MHEPYTDGAGLIRQAIASNKAEADRHETEAARLKNDAQKHVDEANAFKEANVALNEQLVRLEAANAQAEREDGNEA